MPYDLKNHEETSCITETAAMRSQRSRQDSYLTGGYAFHEIVVRPSCHDLFS